MALHTVCADPNAFVDLRNTHTPTPGRTLPSSAFCIPLPRTAERR